MSAFALDGQMIRLLPNGSLQELSQWSENVAAALAKQDGLTLTDAHWEVIQVLRDHYSEYRISPNRKLLKRELSKRFGPDKATEEYLTQLFPHGIMTQGFKIAGVPPSFLDSELESEPVPRSPNRSSSPSMPESTLSSFELNGQVYWITSSGNLVDLHLWDDHVAEYLAAQEGITLTEDHWEVLNYLRQFYFKYGIAPMVKLLMYHMSEELGSDKGSQNYLYQLFPKGPALQGSRIAGLPKPQGCIDP